MLDLNAANYPNWGCGSSHDKPCVIDSINEAVKKAGVELYGSQA
jgi:hypothetical protein